jgi:hypothetical protein
MSYPKFWVMNFRTDYSRNCQRDWLDGAPGQFRAGRPENQFLRKNGRLSVVEDFADDIPAFVLTPTKLKKNAPKVYNWIDKNFGKQLKPGGQK